MKQLKPQQVRDLAIKYLLVPETAHREVVMGDCEEFLVAAEKASI